jgi:hypothetical protein
MSLRMALIPIAAQHLLATAVDLFHSMPFVAPSGHDRQTSIVVEKRDFSRRSQFERQ